MLIVFSKETGEVINNSGTNSLYPLGPENESEILEDVISRFGGQQTDYGVLRLHDLDQADIVSKTFTHEFTVQNGKIIFGAERIIEEPKPTQSETDLLVDYVIDVDYRVTMIELGLL